MFPRLLSRWFVRQGLTSKAPVRPSRLRLESLEAREVPAVTIADIPNQSIPNTESIFLPVTVTNTPAGTVTTTVQSDNTSVIATVLTSGRTIQFDVSTENTADPSDPATNFSGTLTFRLFEDVAPIATSRIVQLINDGFFLNKDFFRVVDNFMIQTGSPTNNGLGGSIYPNFVDEFNRNVTFASPGVLAMANSGSDTNNSQIFITDPDLPLTGSTARPQFLNFKHTIFGILTNGFDLYNKITKIPVTTQSTSTEVSKPTQSITIKGARVLTDDPNNAVLQLVTTTGFTGTANITVTSKDGSGSDGTDTFTVTGVNDGNNSRAFIDRSIVSSVSTTQGTPVSFTIPGVDVDGDPITYTVQNSSFNGLPTNVTVSIDQSTGKVTLSPALGFTGTVTFKVGVRDQLNRISGGSLNDEGNFDTQVMTLTVTAGQATPVITVGSNASTITAGGSITLNAEISGVTSTAGSVSFFDGSNSLGSSTVTNGKAQLVTQLDTAGVRSITAQYTPQDTTNIKSVTSNPILVTVDEKTVVSPPPVSPPTTPEEPVSPPTTSAPFTVEAGVEGSEPRVIIRNADGSVRFSFLAYDQGMTGGVRTATADVTGDGIPDLITVPGYGGAPIIKVFDTTTGKEIFSLMVFEPSFRGGLYLKVGDSLGRGYSQVLVGAGYLGGPRVSLFDVSKNSLILNYFAADQSLRGGVSLDFAEMYSGQGLYIIAGAGPGAGPQVSFFDGKTGAKKTSFFVGDTNDRSGIAVRAGEVDSETGNRFLYSASTGDPSRLESKIKPIDYYDPSKPEVNVSSDTLSSLFNK